MANNKSGQRKAKPRSARSVSKAKNGKTLAIFVSLTKAERTKLEKIGKASDIGLGEVMRAALLRCPLKIKAPVEKAEPANKHYGKNKPKAKPKTKKPRTAKKLVQKEKVKPVKKTKPRAKKAEAPVVGAPVQETGT